jgi:hypothetical protein
MLVPELGEAAFTQASRTDPRFDGCATLVQIDDAQHSDDANLWDACSGAEDKIVVVATSDFTAPRKREPMAAVAQTPSLILQLRDSYIGFKMEGFGNNEEMSRLQMGSGFVKLSIAKWSEVDQREALKGDKEKMRQMLEKKLEKVELPTIWNDKERRRVVVQGAAGAGKTTLLRWIAHEWARGALWNDQFEAVVFLKLRNVDKKAKSLLDVLVSGMFMGDEEMKGPVREFLKWTKESSVVAAGRMGRNLGC